jgi:ketosteroid isomerase-like protein
MGTQVQTDEQDAALIATFYAAFARGDAEAMVACYHPDVVFIDPAFGLLRGDEARDMWRMLCKASKDLTIATADIGAKGGRGHAQWTANYTFSTGQHVTNVVDAEFDFAQGLIIRHMDDFSFSTWAGQAFGLPGKVFGRVPVLPQAAFSQLARRQLSQYRAKQRR